MIPSTHDFAARVAAHAGLPLDRCERATTVVLGRLGAYLKPAERRFVADELPPALALAFMDSGGNLAIPLEELVLVDDIDPIHAREMIACVCNALADGLSTEALAVLRDAASGDLRVLLVPPSAPAERVAVAPRRNEPLATAHPGSHHPIADTPPGPQRDSVAASNPHAATKLSTTSGTTQERLREDLAEGDPDPTRKISG